MSEVTSDENLVNDCLDIGNNEVKPRKLPFYNIGQRVTSSAYYHHWKKIVTPLYGIITTEMDEKNYYTVQWEGTVEASYISYKCLKKINKLKSCDILLNCPLQNEVETHLINTDIVLNEADMMNNSNILDTSIDTIEEADLINTLLSTSVV